MKKIVTMITALSLVLGLAACGKNNPNPDSTSGTTPGESTTVSTEQTTDTNPPATDAADSPKALLEAIWNQYKEDDKFPAAGGDYDEANMVDGAPGNVGLDNADDVERLVGFPAASIGEIDAAASLFHMMNGNTFTCGALRLTDAGKLDEAAKEIRDYIMAKQWMCGFPDKLIVVSVDNYLISCFGAEDLVNTFRDKLQAAYSGAVVITDEPIVA